ncbi:MAG: hypothetical protein JRI55_19295 [Deltaproteobacteria bacterium]|jgi:hypothetical protein|nr:hypothetical protein [Deltaproteobacteria bacterium]
MAPPKFLIVWDLDHTIGVFDAMAHVATAYDSVTIELRSDMDRTLTRLTEEGFSHTVLTLASRTYAEVILRATGLRDHFLEVSGMGERSKGDAEGIARKFGIPVEECHDRMLFVGDHPLFDVPQDRRVVFHFEPHPLRRSAAAVAELALTLRERGNGSLRAGFDELARPERGPSGISHVTVDGVGPLVFARRDDGCPIVAFDDHERPSDEPDAGTPVTFVPAEIQLG